MHLTIHYTIVLKGCISQCIRSILLEGCMVSTLSIVLEGCISQYIRLLYWRDASHNTLDYCIGGMHLTIH